MRKVLLSGLAALALAGCGTQTSSDNYKFETKEYVQNPVWISIVEAQSQSELERYAKNYGVELSAGSLGAFSTISADGKTCRIFAIDPAVRYQPEWLGHELAHCFYGRWHGDQGRGGRTTS